MNNYNHHFPNTINSKPIQQSHQQTNPSYSSTAAQSINKSHLLTPEMSADLLFELFNELPKCFTLSQQIQTITRIAHKFITKYNYGRP